MTPGQSLSFSAQVRATDGSPLPAGLVYRWQPNPEVTFSPVEGRANGSSGRFSATGTVKVWVQVLQPSGPVLSTIAESEPLEIDVVAPQITLQAFPSDPYPGQDVRITASERPAGGDAITYWWEYAGNALTPGATSDQRVYTFAPKDLTAVTVTAHAKAKDGGTDCAGFLVCAEAGVARLLAVRGMGGPCGRCRDHGVLPSPVGYQPHGNDDHERRRIRLRLGACVRFNDGHERADRRNHRGCRLRVRRHRVGRLPNDEPVTFDGGRDVPDYVPPTVAMIAMRLGMLGGHAPQS